MTTRLLLAELKRVKIGVLQFESQPHGLTSQSGDVGSGLPRDNPVKLVAELQVAVGKCKAGDWLPGCVLQFNANAARCGRREVDSQPIPIKPQRLGDQFTAAQRSA